MVVSHTDTTLQLSCMYVFYLTTANSSQKRLANPLFGPNGSSCYRQIFLKQESLILFGYNLHWKPMHVHSYQCNYCHLRDPVLFEHIQHRRKSFYNAISFVRHRCPRFVARSNLDYCPLGICSRKKHLEQHPMENPSFFSILHSGEIHRLFHERFHHHGWYFLLEKKGVDSHKLLWLLIHLLDAQWFEHRPSYCHILAHDLHKLWTKVLNQTAHKMTLM